MQYCLQHSLPAISGSRRTWGRGFNLVEAAIVLGIVGLIIGGIWVAAAGVRQNQRINETASGILQLALNAKRLYNYSTYPKTDPTYNDIGAVLSKAGASPFPLAADGYHLTAPMGAVLQVNQTCVGTYPSSGCPTLSITVGAPNDGHSSTVTRAECTHLIRRFASIARDSSDLIQAFVCSSGGACTNYYAPFNGSTAECPADWQVLIFAFKP